MLKILLVMVGLIATSLAATARRQGPVIPAFWDDDLLHDYELPLATADRSPKHVSRDYYYALPERVLYKPTFSELAFRN